MEPGDQVAQAEVACASCGGCSSAGEAPSSRPHRGQPGFRPSEPGVHRVSRADVADRRREVHERDPGWRRAREDILAAGRELPHSERGVLQPRLLGHDPGERPGGPLIRLLLAPGQVFEFDGLSKIKQFGYTDQISKQMVLAIIDSGAGIKIANMSYPQELPSTSPVVRFAGEQIAQAGAPRASVTSLSPDQTVLLFFSKWANYRYRERTEWLHDAQFGVWKLLRDMAIPVRVICEDNLAEDLTRYKGLVLAFSPVDVMPAEDRVAIERLGLPIVADVWEVPQAPPSGPGDLNGTEANRSGQSQNRVVIGKAIGYHYLHGADRTVCRRVMEQAMVKAGVRR